MKSQNHFGALTCEDTGQISLKSDKSRYPINLFEWRATRKNKPGFLAFKDLHTVVFAPHYSRCQQAKGHAADQQKSTQELLTKTAW